jgi:low affinity Fe/Cu permease
MQELIEKASLTLTNWIGTPASLMVHTIFFVASFGLVLFGVPLDAILLVLTTAVSLEAIYLAIFIQMTVNRNTEDLEEVHSDLEDIHEEFEDLGEDVQEISEDVEEISEDIDRIEERDEEESEEEDKTAEALAHLQAGLQKLLQEVENLKHRQHPIQ